VDQEQGLAVGGDGGADEDPPPKEAYRLATGMPGLQPLRMLEIVHRGFERSATP
jgi:hypothetical protein